MYLALYTASIGYKLFIEFDKDSYYDLKNNRRAWAMEMATSYLFIY